MFFYRKRFYYLVLENKVSVDLGFWVFYRYFKSTVIMRVSFRLDRFVL